MTRTTAYLSRAGDSELARAHTAAPAGSQPIAFIKSDATMHAAGGLVSTAADLTRWLRVQVNGGKQFYPPWTAAPAIGIIAIFAGGGLVIASFVSARLARHWDLTDSR